MNIEKIANDVIVEFARDYDRPRRDYGDRPRRGREYTPKGYIKKDMNPETYALRRRVIEIIYEAKNLARKELGIDLPRIQARIVDKDPESVLKRNALGTACLGTSEIWIPKDTLDSTYYNLKSIVFHEILHAAYCVPHIKSSPLMSAYYAKMTDEDINKWFIKHVKESGKVKND